jgi:hypothetical protein
VKSIFDLMKQFPMFAALAAASSDVKAKESSSPWARLSFASLGL